MKPIERLNNLSTEVTRTFHPDFVFLVYTDKIQHFPARNWSREQILEEIKKRLDHSLMTTNWHGHEVIYSPDLEVFALIPKK
ncbi:hypothetical protein A5844_000399 [Enterococcus sp. 10A9_DIV0425]|uniref:Uncharacterized protein n=1 Tax=Candidatus Enterococcus wittei TaxID=1987383 RepID=A0A2C9XPQ8_9ENTE|nr:hypothetical protein [Enterococcus sp. 10A9_DIV0425]OTP12183.1 hypothetical protein A5844_000399 [Enterococcus sp. 10A9_DIV0425]THE16155.1 hypothetical protein E1H99_00955 [Enterococcus hirae]